LIKRVDAADIPEAAAKLTVAERIRTVVKRGPKPITDIASVLDVDPDTIRKTVTRNTRRFRYYDDASGNKVVSLVDWRHKASAIVG
jgi:IS30 family transposase